MGVWHIICKVPNFRTCICWAVFYMSACFICAGEVVPAELAAERSAAYHRMEEQPHTYFMNLRYV